MSNGGKYYSCTILTYFVSIFLFFYTAAALHFVLFKAIVTCYFSDYDFTLQTFVSSWTPLVFQMLWVSSSNKELLPVRWIIYISVQDRLIRIIFMGQVCLHIQGIWLRFSSYQCTDCTDIEKQHNDLQKYTKGMTLYRWTYPMFHKKSKYKEKSKKYNTSTNLFSWTLCVFPAPWIISCLLTLILWPFGGARPIGWEPLDLIRLIYNKILLTHCYIHIKSLTMSYIVIYISHREHFAVLLVHFAGKYF